MNIDEYRALKAQMEQEKQNQGGTPNAQTEPTATPNVATEQTKDVEVPKSTEQTPPATETNQTPEQTKVVEPPATVQIDGKELTLDELKNGYLRQSDYTKKTQELSRKAQQAEQALQMIQQIQSNPQAAQQLAQEYNLPILDPLQSHVSDLESRYYDLLIQNDLHNLHDKYGDFNDTEVLQIATSENITNLETAYQLFTARKGGGSSEKMDIESIKQSLRDEILKELKSQQEASVDTSTIIQTGGDVTPVRDTTPQLTPSEKKVARAMRMSEEEYLKWRDKK